MEFEQLEAKGLLRRVKPSPRRAGDRLKLARRDLRAARKLAKSEPDWAFAAAYNSMLQATRALMAGMGYRENVKEGGHVAVVRFAEIALGEALGEGVRLFDWMRRQRHTVVYETIGAVDPDTLADATAFAAEFLTVVEERLGKLPNR